jgi:acetate kinase
MKILVINAGSSSLKYQLIDSTDGAVMAIGLAERIGIEGSRLKHEVGDDEVVFDQDMPTHAEAIAAVVAALVHPEHGCIASLDEIDAVGHRVVHGGERFAESVVITAEVKEAIRQCFPLAPLHNPPNMMGIEASEQAMPGVPMVAVFDTAFHQTMPDYAFMYALPYEVYEDLGVRRYGFHGTSHKYVSAQAAEMLGKPIEDVKIITLHLGNGSSISAIDGGKCVDTTMGLTPLAGVPMGTRCGDIDPAIVKFLMDEGDYTIADIDKMMNKQSGMLGVSGVSSDFRDLSAAAGEGNKRAALALAMFKYQCRKVIGSYAAAMGGVDAIVFTAGVGENDRSVRAGICEGLDFMGIRMDVKQNEEVPRGVSADLSTADSPAKIFVIPTNEELVIAQDTARLVSELKK